jgi:Glycosyltransferase family 10 (fucosyltransferase) C-term
MESNQAERKIVVFDAGGPFGRNNLLFKREMVKDKHGMATCYLYEECARMGYELMTPDLYYALAVKPARAIFIRNNVGMSEADTLMKMGLHPAILLGFEHPLYACEFYWNLKHHTKDYDHTFMPSGARDVVSPKTKFHPWFSPQPYSMQDHVESNFAQKKFLTMISGNARIHILKRLYTTVMNIVSPIPTLVNRELYHDRLEAMQYFSQFDDFEFYGRGWENPVRYTFGKYDEAIKKSYRGEIPDKTVTLRQYKFSLCFENAVFGGWITEKIIDCLFAGCVPIYWGAPDITDYIPAECFIDYRKFKSFDELNQFLRAMTAEEYQKYIDAINKWIPTGSYNFSQEKYVKDMTEIFATYF